MSEVSVWKYELNADKGTQTVEVPMPAEPLSMLVQKKGPVIYFRVNPAMPKVIVVIKSFDTGSRLPKDWLQGYKFIGTVSIPSGFGYNPNGHVRHFFVEEYNTPV